MTAVSPSAAPPPSPSPASGGGKERGGAAHRNLVGLGREALAAEMAAFGAEPFRARQLWHWIYHRGAADFGAMTSLSKVFREQLDASYELSRPAVSRELVSTDGTRK